MDAFRGGPLLFRNRQPMLDVNAFDDEYTILRFFDFPANIARQPAIGLDFARLQRAPEGSKQSTSDRCNQIVNGRGMGLSKIRRLHSIVVRNRSMDTEDHRIGFAGNLRKANRPVSSFDARLGHIRNFRHRSSPLT
jgi:hypothetical protein